MELSPILPLKGFQGNSLFIKREDLLPFSFGGNKARKVGLFLSEIDAGDFDCVLTYGSGSSNHCRVVANACCIRKLECIIISPEDEYEDTFNSQMMEIFGARIIQTPLGQVSETIEKTLSDLVKAGRHPYFIAGGGHGNTGTKAYVQCYQEIKEYEREQGVFFDYIFLASGTGTTQAGLICGQLLAGDRRRIVGISIARKNPAGRDIIVDSVRSFMGERASDTMIQEGTVFVDDYTNGYGKGNDDVAKAIMRMIQEYGVPLDDVYTGKAFMGMQEYIKREQIANKNILFIHTGGMPLFFDFLRRQREKI